MPFVIFLDEVCPSLSPWSEWGAILGTVCCFSLIAKYGEVVLMGVMDLLCFRSYGNLRVDMEFLAMV